MKGKRITFLALSGVAALGALYAILAMLTQGMLGGTSSQEIWWDRVIAWWVDFLAAGLLLMLAIYLWRRSGRVGQSVRPPDSTAKWRVVILPLGHLLLTGCLYFADFAWYLREYQAGEAGAQERSSIYLLIAVLLLAGAVLAFWQGRKLQKKIAAA
jgi:hypothetical protein